MTNVETGGSSPSRRTSARGRPDLLLGLAQGRVLQVGVLGVATAAGKGDLTGVAAQVSSTAGEDRVRLLVSGGEEQRHEHRRGYGCGRCGGRYGRDTLLGRQVDALDALLEHDLAVERTVDGALRGDHAQALELLLRQVLG